MESTSLGDVVDVIADVPVCFILCKQANLIEEKCSRIERVIEMCRVAENRLKC